MMESLGDIYYSIYRLGDKGVHTIHNLQSSLMCPMTSDAETGMF